jgi:hypothetical protein
MIVKVLREVRVVKKTGKRKRCQLMTRKSQMTKIKEICWAQTVK